MLNANHIRAEGAARHQPAADFKLRNYLPCVRLDVSLVPTTNGREHQPSANEPSAYKSCYLPTTSLRSMNFDFRQTPYWRGGAVYAPRHDPWQRRSLRRGTSKHTIAGAGPTVGRSLHSAAINNPSGQINRIKIF